MPLLSTLHGKGRGRVVAFLLARGIAGEDRAPRDKTMVDFAVFGINRIANLKGLRVQAQVESLTKAGGNQNDNCDNET